MGQYGRYPRTDIIPTNYSRLPDRYTDNIGDPAANLSLSERMQNTFLMTIIKPLRMSVPFGPDTCRRDPYTKRHNLRLIQKKVSARCLR